MLITEVLNSKAIAIAATHNASNDIPYLGLQFFPEKKKMGLDLKWIKTHSGLPVTLKPSNFDAIPVLRAREGLKTERTEMAFFRESMHIKEEDEQEIMRITESGDPYMASVLQSIYDDTNTLVKGAEVVPEIMRMQLLMGQNIVLESENVNYTYNYDPDGKWAETNYAELTGTSAWSDAENATPIADLIRAKKALAKKGIAARYVLMNSNTFNYLINSKEVKDNMLAQNLTAVITPNDDDIKNIIANRAKLTIVVYDKMYKDYEGAEKYFYADDFVTLLPAGALGSTWFGTTPEERTARQVADVDVSMFGTGIAVAVKVEYGPPAKTLTTASEIVLPSFEGMDGVYVYKVA